MVGSCVFNKPKKIVKDMLDCWADPTVSLLVLKSSMFKVKALIFL